MSSLTATDVAFTMVGLMQLVAAAVWALGAVLARATRSAAAHWACYAGLSAVSFAFLVCALHAPHAGTAEVLRAVGNFAAVLAVIALQRGIWKFLGQPAPVGLHGAMCLLTLVVCILGVNPWAYALRVSVNSALLAVLYLSMAVNIERHMRSTYATAWSVLIGTSLVLGAIGHGLRGLRAAFAPHSVALELTADSTLNVVSSMAYQVLAMTFHATLMALVVTRLVDELKRRSRHDSLTGLLNRRAIEEHLAALNRASLRSGAPFSVLMIDLDYFKSINDGFGHAVGDLALKHAAGLLNLTMRESDRLGRFGGEEFLVVLPGIGLAAAGEIAERLRGTLSATPLVHAGVRIPVSASIGVAQWAGRAEDISRLLVRADLALYRAKEQGRDRVVLAPPEDALSAVPSFAETESG